MLVRVVGVRNVRVRVAPRIVAMSMAVRTGGHRLMQVVVMAVVVTMRVLVLDSLVQMFVRMRLGDVKHDTSDHAGRP